MAQSTQVGNHTLPRAETRADRRVGGEGTWAKVRLFLTRTLLWTYERGSWQYDLIVLAILAFIFITPRTWFNDRPTLQLTDLRHSQGFVEMGRTKEGWHYLVDARLVESITPDKPQDAILQILRSRLNKPFRVKSVEVVRDQNNVVLGYTVVVEQ
jgi:hypothetical protein